MNISVTEYQQPYTLQEHILYGLPNRTSAFFTVQKTLTRLRFERYRNPLHLALLQQLGGGIRDNSDEY